MTELAKITPPPTGELKRPDFINPQDKSGLEHITKDDLRLPRLVISQGLSKQLIPTHPKYIEGLTNFTLFNDLSGEIYGKGPLTFVPIHHQTVRLEFDPDNGEKVLDRNVPANDPRMDWHGDEAPKATKFTEFAMFLWNPRRQMWEDVIYSIKETNKENRQAAERLLGFVMFQDGPIYAGYKTIEVGIASNDEGSWGVPIFKNAGFIQDKAFYQHCKKVSESFEGKIIETTREGESEASTEKLGDDKVPF